MLKFENRCWSRCWLIMFGLGGLWLFLWGLAPSMLADEGLESRLKQMSVADLVAQAQLRGDPRAGAMVYYKSAAACVLCHEAKTDASPFGPDLTGLGKATTGQHLVESILYPSRKISEGFETISVLTVDGEILTGMKTRSNDANLILRDAKDLQREVSVRQDEIEEITVSPQSMMPEGLVASLRDERQFYDLIRYLMQLASGGRERAVELKPSAAELEIIDDTLDLDHAGILRSLGPRDLKAGQAIFRSHCQNCHGADGNTPTLPTARAFGSQTLKFGADPYQMFRTLSLGNGLMTAMTHLTPKERYQVVHFIRESLMKASHSQYVAVDDEYLERLPKGDRDGESDVAVGERDYGPVLGSQIGNVVNNALTFRFPGEVSVGYDLHRMQLHDVWRGGFLDLSQTHHYRQRGERMPQIDGESIPGLGTWQWLLGETFELPDDAKPPRGPVREDWARYRGHYLYGNEAVLSYAIHDREILESIQSEVVDELVTLQHTLRIAPSPRELKLCVGRLSTETLSDTGVRSLTTSEPSKSTGPAGGQVAFVTGKPLKRSRRAAQDNLKFANQPWHQISGPSARQLDLGIPDRTVVVRFRTSAGGTLIASTPEKGRWEPNGKTLFVRGGRLVFDIGWVGAMTSQAAVADGRWHTATLVIGREQSRLFLDGELEAAREGFRRAPVEDHVIKIGATATNFGGDFDGEIESIRMVNREWNAGEVRAGFEQADQSDTDSDVLFAWQPKRVPEQGLPIPEATPKVAKQPASIDLPVVAAVVDGQTEGLTWEVEATGRIILNIPGDQQPRVFRILRGATRGQTGLERFADYAKTVASRQGPVDPLQKTRGGPLRWPQRLQVSGKLGESINGYALDTIPIPADNPWNAWLRTSAVDFLPDGRAVVSTHGGDVYLVSGIDSELKSVTWKRFAAGLFEPFGVRVVDGEIYVTCRDGIKRLHDFNHDDEADFIEAFWIDDDVSCSFHAYNFDLQSDSQGNFYFAKAGQYTQHHRPGTIMRIPPEGGHAEVVAWGLRTPNGMGKLDDDRFTVSDNQGPWMPAGKISLIKPDAFLGNMPINDEQDEWLRARHGGELPSTFDEPMIWMPQELDNSCGGQVWVNDERFGPLSGRLLHSSFGKGWLYYLSIQSLNGKDQASIVALPHQWDAGVMRLRVNPHDGQVYGVGLSGWQGPTGGDDGCFQRLRYTGSTVHMIDNVEVTADGVQVRFSFPLDPVAASATDAWQCEMWDYLWSKRYGSDQFSVLNPGEKGRDRSQVTDVEMMDPFTAKLTIPDLQACDQFLIKMRLTGTDGQRFLEDVYLTIHSLASP